MAECLRHLSCRRRVNRALCEVCFRRRREWTAVAEQPPVACGDRLRERGDHERESTREDGQRRDETGEAQERERDEQRRMRGRSGLPDGRGLRTRPSGSQAMQKSTKAQKMVISLLRMR